MTSRPSCGDEPAHAVRQRDDLRADRVQLARGDAADVAEALDRDARVAQRQADAVADGLEDVDDAEAGRLAPAGGAADDDGLAGHDARHGVADLLGVRVHEPRHLALAGAHVRGRDVLLRADDRDELGGVAAREALELADAELARDAPHAALRAAVRAGRAARTSTSSTSRAPRTRRARRPARSESRPSSGPSSACAGRGSRSASAPRRSPSGRGSSRRASAAGRRGGRRTRGRGRASRRRARTGREAMRKSSAPHSRPAATSSASSMCRAMVRGP